MARKRSRRRFETKAERMARLQEERLTSAETRAIDVPVISKQDLVDRSRPRRDDGRGRGG